MTIYTQTPRRQSLLEDYTAPMSSVLGVTVEESLLYAPVSSLIRSGELTIAEQGQPNLPTRLAGAAIGAVMPPLAAYVAAGAPGLPSTFRRAPDSPLLDAETARTKVKDAGVPLTIPDKGIRSRALDILISRKKEEMRRQDVLSRAPGGWAAGAAQLATALGASAIDPLNVASAFIPVVGPTRYGGMLARASGGLGRAAVRARVGAVEGVIGAAAVEPIILGAANQEQADYGLADSLLNIGLGTVLGGGLHVGAGVAADAYKRGVSWKMQRAPATEPLPSILDGMTHPQREQLLRTAVSQAASGREINVEPLVTYEGGGARFGDEFLAGGTTVHEPTVKVDEVTGIEGIAVYHGSPHTFDRFSSKHIGSGEGTQMEGRGLYFGETPDVGKFYVESTPKEEMARIAKAAHGGMHPDSQRQIISQIAEIVNDEGVDALDEYDAPRGFEKAWDAVVQHVKARGGIKGNLYEARINAQPDQFIDLSKKVGEQSPSVRDALHRVARDPEFGVDRIADDMKPRELAALLKGEGATQKLREIGVAGIRYLDAGSTKAGEGSYNYVVFDDSLITTVRRNEENLLRRPEDLRTAIDATFAPEASRLYDIEAVRSADAKIAEAPADDVFPEQAVEEAIIDLMELAAALDGRPPPMGEGKGAAGAGSEPALSFRAHQFKSSGIPVDPEKKMQRFPVRAMIKAAGGVDPDSPLGGELRAMGLTQKNAVGLFRKNGRGALDNLPASESALFQDVPDDGNGYIPEETILEALRDEIAGSPRRTLEEQAQIEEYKVSLDLIENDRELLSTLGINTEGMTPVAVRATLAELREKEDYAALIPPAISPEDYGTYEAMIAREMAEFEELQATAEAYGRAVQEAASCGLRRGTT